MSNYGKIERIFLNLDVNIEKILKNFTVFIRRECRHALLCDGRRWWSIGVRVVDTARSSSRREATCATFTAMSSKHAVPLTTRPTSSWNTSRRGIPSTAKFRYSLGRLLLFDRPCNQFFPSVCPCVCVCCRSITSAIIFSDFHQIPQVARKCGRIDAYRERKC